MLAGGTTSNEKNLRTDPANGLTGKPANHEGPVIYRLNGLNRPNRPNPIL
jgi:hypothetical protein